MEAHHHISAKHAQLQSLMGANLMREAFIAESEARELLRSRSNGIVRRFYIENDIAEQTLMDLCGSSFTATRAQGSLPAQLEPLARRTPQPSQAASRTASNASRASGASAAAAAGAPRPQQPRAQPAKQPPPPPLGNEALPAHTTPPTVGSPWRPLQRVRSDPGLSSTRLSPVGAQSRANFRPNVGQGDLSPKVLQSPSSLPPSSPSRFMRNAWISGY